MMSNVPTIAVLTAVHGRHDVVEKMFRHHAAIAARLSDACNLRMAAVVSPDDAKFMQPLGDELGIFWRECANRPLSRKWQAGLESLSDAIACDAVMILGSDDFATEGYFRMAADRLASGSKGFGPDSIWFYQKSTGNLGQWIGPMKTAGGDTFDIPAGGGRVFSRKLLDAVNWRIWDFNINAGLDTYSSMLLNKSGHRLEVLPIADCEEYAIVDVKDGRNIHAWHRFDFGTVLIGEDAKSQLRKFGIDLDSTFDQSPIS